MPTSFIDEIKTSLPQSRLMYNEYTKEYLVYSAEFYAFFKLAEPHFSYIDYSKIPYNWRKNLSNKNNSNNYTKVNPTVNSTSNWDVLYLKETAPIEVVKAAYKALAKLYHPDINPDNVDKMSKINVAYESILKFFK